MFLLQTPRTAQRWLTLCLGFVLFAHAFLLTFSTFQEYDDEGYMLISGAAVLAGASPYQEVYSQYGPGFFAYHLVMGRLFGIAPTTDSCRYVLLLAWMGTVGLYWLGLRKLSGWLPGATMGAMAAGMLIAKLSFEPAHPQFLIVLLVAAGFCAIALRGSMGLTLAAVCAAFALLIKVNVGGLFLIALGLWIACQLPLPAPLRLVFLLLPAIPVLLMWRSMAAGAWPFAAVYALAMIPAATLLWKAPIANTLSWRDLIKPLVAASVVAAVILGYFLATGATLHALVDGALLRPIQFARNFYAAGPWPVWRILPAAAGAALGVWILLMERSWKALCWWRIAWGISVMGMALFERAYVLIHLMVALAWLILPLERNEWKLGNAKGRLLLYFLALLMPLQAYPVAGTQVYIGGAFLALGGAVALSEGWKNRTVRMVLPHWLRQNVGLAGIICVGLAMTVLSPVGLRHSWKQYVATAPLGLPGAKAARMNPEQADAYRSLALAVRSQCDSLLTIPGFNSLHLWSSVKPLTYYNATVWQILLTPQELNMVGERLSAAERPCVVRNEKLLHFWRVSGEDSSLPMRIAREQFSTYGTYGNFVLQRRTSTPVKSGDEMERKRATP